MLYGVFSDVHSNLEALEAVLKHFEDSRVEAYICCGDLVGYGPDPNACLDRIRGLKNLHVICGNHDLGALGRMDVDWFNAYARAAALWTRGALTPEHRVYLENLSARLETPDFTLCHGTPRRPAEEYLLSAAQFRDNMSRVHTWPLFVGHTHMPSVFRQKQDGTVEAVFLEDGHGAQVEQAAYGAVPVAFNPGSVGQPRDQDRRAACGVYDSSAKTFKVTRLSYDVAAVQEKIRAAGLPEYLALRLAYGQ